MTPAPPDTASPYRLATAAEITESRASCASAGCLARSKRIAYLGLLDPARGPARDARTGGSGSSSTMSPAPAPRTSTVSVSSGTVDVRRRTRHRGHRRTAGPGRGVRGRGATPGHRRALAEGAGGRGLDVGKVRVAPLSAGVFEYPEEKGRRILRGLAFVQDFPEDSAWAHPVDGLVAYVDVVSKDVDAGAGHRRRPRPGRARQLHRPGAHRPAAHHAEAHQHHPAGGPQLHRHRRQPR